MRPSALRGPIVCVAALALAFGSIRPATAGLISAEASPFVGEFRAFVKDFSRWDAAHLDMPLMLLALTPEKQRPEMLFLLWYLWMHDHPSTAAATFNFPQLLSLTEIYQPSVSSIPGGGNGGGTIASNPVPPSGSGTTSGSAGSAPEPSALALAACGSLGLFAYRLVRARAGRRR